MKFFKRTYLLTCIFFLFLMLAFCQRQPTETTLDHAFDADKVDIAFKIPVPDDVKSLVHSALALVTAADMDTISIELKVTPDHVEGVIPNVPLGKNRFFEIFVFDRDSTLSFYGSKYADVQSGFVTNVEIMLQPVGNSGTVVIIGYFRNPEREKIVYSTFDSHPPYDDGELFIMNPDDSERIQLTDNPGADYHPNISPKGDQIVFVRNLDPEGKVLNSHIFIMNIDGTGQKQLTFPPIAEDSPCFSPDGRRIVFRKTTENGISNIFVMNSDGTEQINITKDRVAALHPMWAKDNQIYFVTHGNDYRIWQISPDGRELNAISPFRIGAHERVQFTADMKQILYDSHRFPNQIMIADFPLFLNSKPLTSGEDTGGFCLSPDDSKMIFSQGSHEEGYYLFLKDVKENTTLPLRIKAIHSDWEEIRY